MEISKIRVKSDSDPDPDLSWIGKYSDVWEKHAIDRFEDRHHDNREYRYFHPANPEYAKEEYQRMEAINEGQIWFIGIWVEADILIKGQIQVITSGGLWGIESDSDQKYIDEVVQDELSNLTDQLKELGFSEGEIQDAIDNKIEELI